MKKNNIKVFKKTTNITNMKEELLTAEKARDLVKKFTEKELEEILDTIEEEADYHGKSSLNIYRGEYQKYSNTSKETLEKLKELGYGVKKANILERWFTELKYIISW